MKSGRGMSHVLDAQIFSPQTNGSSLTIRLEGTPYLHQCIKGARYLNLLIIHELLVAMFFFPAGVQDKTLKEESQRLAS